MLNSLYLPISFTTLNYDEDGVEQKNHYSHHDFLKEIGLCWMNPTMMEEKEVKVDYSDMSVPFFPDGDSAISTFTAKSASVSESSQKRKRSPGQNPDNVRRKRVTSESVSLGGYYWK